MERVADQGREDQEEEKEGTQEWEKEQKEEMQTQEDKKDPEDKPTPVERATDGWGMVVCLRIVQRVASGPSPALAMIATLRSSRRVMPGVRGVAMHRTAY